MKLLGALMLFAFISAGAYAVEKKSMPAPEKGLCTTINPDGTKSTVTTTKDECSGTFEVATKVHKKAK